MVIGLLAGVGAAVLFGLAAVLQAHAVRALENGVTHLAGFVRDAVRNPLILLVVAAYLGGFVLHAVAIWFLPLYLAQASIALSLPISALAARRVNETVSGRQWLAVAAVVVGLLLLALGSGDPGEVRVSPTFVALLYVAAVVIVAATRVRSLPAGEWFGTLSGLAYAGSAIAVRGVAWPPGVLVGLAAVAVSVFGLLGFWLYSTGLERGGVSPVTAPLVVGQTAVPGVVGVALLGDGVRPGWAVAVVAGVLLAMAGATLVSRATAGPESGSAPDPVG